MTKKRASTSIETEASSSIGTKARRPRRPKADPSAASDGVVATRQTDAAPSGGTTAAQTGPRHEEVAFAAYVRYLDRQGAPGSAFDDWLAAEQELKGRGEEAAAK
jgi:hypothetical protein